MTRYTLLAALLLGVWGTAGWSQEQAVESQPFEQTPASREGDPFGPPDPSQIREEEQSVLQIQTEASQSVLDGSTSDTPVFLTEKSSPHSERILRALSSPITAAGFNFTENSLEEVVAFLRDEYEIEIQLDIQALDDLGLSSDDTVTVNIRHVSLASALKLMLKQHDLTYLIVDDYLLITSEDEALARLSVRVYPVGDLLQPGEGQPQTSAASVDDLIEVIITTVAGDTWAVNGGGEAEIRPLQPGMLIISQTQAVHEEIANLLAALRRARQHELAIPYTPVEKKAKNSSSVGGYGSGGGAPADKQSDQPK